MALAIGALGSLLIASAAAASSLTYHGGQVARDPQVRVIFWGSNWNKNPGAREQIQGLFSSLSGSDYQGIFTQYYDTDGPISQSVGFDSWTDQSITAPSNVNWQHIEEEIQYAMVQRSWAGGINNVFLVLPAPGSGYQSGFVLGCGAHYFSSLAGVPEAYVGWPGDSPFKSCPSASDPGQGRDWVSLSVTASHEYAEEVTNPITKKFAGTFTGWITEEGEQEIADKCDSVTGGLANGFHVSYLWDNSQNQCTVSHPVPPSPPPPPPAPPVRVAFADATNASSTSGWERKAGGPWQEVAFWGHKVAAGSSPETLEYGGTKHIFYVDALNNNSITDWSWNPSTGWQQEFLFGHAVAKGTSPSGVVINGTPHLYFVDANNNNSITEWTWTSSAGWQQNFLYGHPVAAGTSPSATVENGAIPRVFFNDAANNNTMTMWAWTPSEGWQQTFFYGHTMTKGSSPSALMYYGNPEVFFSDATNNNSMSIWAWNSVEGWKQVFLYGHALTAGSSPSTIMWEGHQEAFFSDATNNNSMSVWVGTPGWTQAFLYGHPIAAGTSPSATTEGTTPHIYFVDALNNNSITDWNWSPGAGWQQGFLYGHQVMAGSSPSGF